MLENHFSFCGIIFVRARVLDIHVGQGISGLQRTHQWKEPYLREQTERWTSEQGIYGTVSNPVDQGTYIFLSLCLFLSIRRILPALGMGSCEQETGVLVVRGSLEDMRLVRSRKWKDSPWWLSPVCSFNWEEVWQPLRRHEKHSDHPVHLTIR